MTEWLRCVTRNHMGYARAGSNPAAVGNFLKMEKKYVQDVYNRIACHFSATRYKAWPVVERFVASLEAGSIGMDCGCGNGKNMMLYKENILTLGYDNSIGLASIAYQSTGLPTLLGDVRSLPLRSSCLDYTLSIAVLHHLERAEDRLAALREMVRVMNVNGIGLVFVWAREQEAIYKNAGLEVLNEAGDYLVPWKTPDGTIHKRFYHLFSRGELDALIVSIPQVSVIETGYDRDNWFVVFARTE